MVRLCKKLYKYTVYRNLKLSRRTRTRTMMKILSILRGVANLLSESVRDEKNDCCERCQDTKRECLESLEQAYREASYLIPNDDSREGRTGVSPLGK